MHKLHHESLRPDLDVNVRFATQFGAVLRVRSSVAESGENLDGAMDISDASEETGWSLVAYLSDGSAFSYWNFLKVPSGPRLEKTALSIRQNNKLKKK